MEFSVAPQIFEKNPTYCVGGVIAAGINNRQAGEKSYQLLQEAAAQARQKLGDTPVSEHPFIAAWREAFRQMGIKPSEYPSSIEALLKRVARGDDPPNVSPAVNLSNAVALKYLLPMGGHDLDQLVGNFQVRTAHEGDLFSPAEIKEGDEGRVESVTPGEPVYVDEAEVRTRRWVWRQGRKARITSDSQTIFFPIDGFSDLNEAEVKAAAEELAQLLTEYLGAHCQTFFVNKAQPRVAWNITPAQEEAGVSRPDDTRQKGTFAKVDVILNPRRQPDAIDRLLTRAVADVVTREELEAKLRSGKKLRVKLGIDPTGPKIHIGRSVALLKLRDFQELGHQIVLICGSFTAMIGDASDKDATRPLLTREVVERNMERYKEQIGLILDLDKVEWHYNSDWFDKMTFADMMTKLLPRFTVAQMTERENFRERMRAGKPVSLQEILYPIMQGYDSVMIKADVEIGGTDQLFNLMTGREMQEMFGQSPQSLLMNVMINGTDNRKMSTSQGNGIYIIEEPRNQYGQIMSTVDELIIPYFEAITRAPMEEVEQMQAEIEAGANPVIYKHRLAHTLVEMYHGKEAADDAADYFRRTISEKQIPDDIPEFQFAAGEVSLRDLLVTTKLAASKNAAERLIGEGAITINGQKFTEPKGRVTLENGMILKKGRQYARVRLD
jgi:tyrosyl-tRNA synthetase